MAYFIGIMLLILTFPPFKRRYLLLEKTKVGEIDTLWWLIWGIIGYSLLKEYYKPTIVHNIYICLFYTVILVELIIRILIKYYFQGSRNTLLQKIYAKVISSSDTKGMWKSIAPHPFLQFTGPRDRLKDQADYYLGFKKIKLSDIPKPLNTIRIACLGGSTTASGWPEILEEYLADSNLLKKKIQVFNFGMGWWSSVHSTINFVLNVIDFEPDYVLFHNNPNDHNYRGYQGLRGDCSHAYKFLDLPKEPDERIYNAFIIYRLFKIAAGRKFPKLFRFLPRYYGLDKAALKSAKSFIYDPRAALYP